MAAESQPPPCPTCPASTAQVVRQAPLGWPESGLDRLVLHGTRQHICQGCGGETVTISGLGPLCRALARKLVWQVPRLTAGQLGFLRKRCELTGQELAAQLHVPPSVLSRWLHPRGEIPDRTFSAATEVLFRVLVAQRTLCPADVWGLLNEEALVRVASEPARQEAWLRATLLDDGADEESVAGDPKQDIYWLVQDAHDEAAAWKARRPRQISDDPLAPVSPPTVPTPERRPLALPPAKDGSPAPDWLVRLTPRVAKQAAQMPDRVCEALARLVRRIAEAGPVRGDWPNYGVIMHREGHHHCHLVKSRSTYVACWRRPDPRAKDIEIYYLGTHEKARY